MAQFEMLTRNDMMKLPLFVPLLMLASGVLQTAAGDVSWNQFRGPNGSGVADAFKPPVKLDARSLIWKRPVPSRWMQR